MIEFVDIILAAMQQLVNQRNTLGRQQGSVFSTSTIYVPLENNNYYYTNVFERYCAYVQNSQECNPYVHLTVKLIQGHQSGFAYDAGWFGLALACKLITAAVRSDVPPHTIMKGYKVANSLVLNYFNQLKHVIDNDSETGHLVGISLDFSNAKLMYRVISSFFDSLNGGSVYSSRSSRKDFCNTLLDTFVSSTSYGIVYDSVNPIFEGNNSGTSCIKLNTTVIYHLAPGFQLSDSLCCGGAVCMDIPPINDLPMTVSAESDSCNTCVLIVLLVDDNMELPRSEAAGTPGTGRGFFEHVASFSPVAAETALESVVSIAETAYLSKVADVICSCNIGVVICQKRIHPLLIKWLTRRGVICVPRVSIRYLAYIQKLSGAIVVGNICTIVPSYSSTDPPAPGNTNRDHKIDRIYLGLLSRVQNKNIFGRQFVVAIGVDWEIVDSVDQLNIRLGANKPCFVYVPISTSASTSTKVSATSAWSAEEYSRVCGRTERVSTLFIAAELENDCVELRFTCESIFRMLERLYVDRQLIFADKWLEGAVANIRSSVCTACCAGTSVADDISIRSFRHSDGHIKLYRAAYGSSKCKDKGKDRNYHIGQLLYADVLEECNGDFGSSSQSPSHHVAKPDLCFHDHFQCMFSHMSMLSSVIDAVQTVLDVDGIINV